MIHHQRTRTLNANPDAVWNIIERFMHIDEFAPLVKSVDALTDGDNRVGSKRRCHFEDGNSLVEEVTAWEAQQSYRVRLSETEPMPLKQAFAELRLEPEGLGKTKVVWSMDYRIKYGPFGWLLGQTLMKIIMSKIIDGNLVGLEEMVQSNKRVFPQAV